MLTKEYIRELKYNDNGNISALISNETDVGSINFVLENLGRLPNDFNIDFLYNFLEHTHHQVRLNAVKNIGKMNDKLDVNLLYNLYKKEKDTSVRREIVSSIGRQKRCENKPLLYNFLNDNDPKIVCQAIRGLLVFDTDKDVEEHLRPFVNHPNEMVRSIIYKEYFANDKKNKNDLSHSETYNFLKNVVVNADVLEVLKYVPAESVHLTFTSPPYYNARDYSIYPSYQEYLDFLEKVFIETHRITKEGRFLIVNTSPIIIPRVSRSHSSKRYGIPFDLHPYLVKNGWEFVDDIVWLKPEASVKNRIGGFMQHRKPLGYKPNAVTEYLMVYRKSTEKLLDWNMRSYDDKIVEESKVSDGYETTNVWKIDPCFDKVHSAVFPVELCKRVIQYYSYRDDLVFDPFAGSGTLGRTAKALNRFFFLTEQNTKYFEYMQSKQKPQVIFSDRITKFQTLEEFRRGVNFCIFLIFLLTFSSCATIVNKKTTEVNIISNSDSVQVYINNDSLNWHTLPTKIDVMRSKNNLKITVQKDTVQKQIEVKSKNSNIFWFGNLCSYGLGYIADLTNSKRFTYPKKIIIDFDEKDVPNLNPTPWFKEPQKGLLNIKYGIPEGNHFYLNKGNGYGSAFGFMFLTAGLEYYFSDKYCLSTNFGALIDFMLPFPAPVDHLGDYNQSYAFYGDIKIGSDYKRLHYDAGLQFNQTSYYERETIELFPEYIDILKYSKIQNNLGLAFSTYYRVSKRFNLGLNYYPSFLVLERKPKIHYSHLLFFELLFRFETYRPNQELMW
ncbi:MAG: HEAT repeat domain-containing protein [Bacteroidetes bacterium]|nr:HEAT repeat domain-containing protein [Bacteroidota bacterium]